MKEIRHEVDGEPVVINVVEHEDDLEGFRDFIRGNLRFLGLDSETTGLDIYSDKFRCRLVQFGTPTESWVVPVDPLECPPKFEEDVRIALRGVQGFVLHNAAYDLQVFERCFGIPMEELWPKVTDTKILAHLVDPRMFKEGGAGHSLEEATRHYIDADIADNVKTLMADLAKAHKTTKANVWKKVPLDDPHYLLYSGMDPILAARLMRKLIPLVPSTAADLVPYEHKLAMICSMMERTGFLLDTEYTTSLAARLKYDESRYNEIALNHGCEKVNSTEMVADVLESRGVVIKGRTPGGARQVNDDLLSSLAEQGDEFAHAVIEAKKAGKWRKTWVQKFLDTRDSNDRVHPGINPLQARTGRMSITNPPTQTLPAEGWAIRRCFIADEGHLITSVDYATQELRVLAYLSGDQTMIEAFRRGADLHQMTADAAGVDRKVGKMANFLQVYGGGPGKLAEDAKISFPVAKRVVEAFAETYPGVAALSQRLQIEASESGGVVTPKGRWLPVDPTRGYAALNYVIQSTSRDVTGEAVVRLHDAGWTPYIRLPIHDEVLASLPADRADRGAEIIGQIMREQMGPVDICTDPTVGGRSWGSLYVKDEELPTITDPYLLPRAA
ncbi:DNA polymerase [Mycobacterium paragordonae]|uniref:DNA polymerase I n=1 Tax=Mycobacterium paragordonae TaxID=1389713 RepID=A0AAJ1RXM2_9MYCO|nr:DNA polymerase [Mycobacterium paragordonae]MDP7733691.1 DNA polymerase [Mycobacterium paragordonae]